MSTNAWSRTRIREKECWGQRRETTARGTSHVLRLLGTTLFFHAVCVCVVFFVVPRINRGVFVGPRPGRGKPIRPRSKSPTSVQYIFRKRNQMGLFVHCQNETHWVSAKYQWTRNKNSTLYFYATPIVLNLTITWAFKD